MHPFEIDSVVDLLREAVKPFPKAAMFALADEGCDSLFEQLISCIISIRTYDEVSLPLSCRYLLVLALLSFNGVGPKCAHLALGIACNQACISVDIHVHRVTNRWGAVQTKTPEKTTLALEAELPPSYWIEINRLLVPFGKHICTGTLPHCSTCPLLEVCQRVGVQKYR